MGELFSINQILFHIYGYSVSYIEFIGTLAGVIAVWLAAKSKILTWPIGLINIVLFFIIFYQVQLYSDMFLQVYFFGISIYGWIFWDKDYKSKHKIRTLNMTSRISLTALIVIATVVFGFLISKIHLWSPDLFPKPAAYPYADTWVAVSSIVANTLLARRILENWVIWIAVDVVCVYLYFSKDIVFVSFEYLIFLMLAIFGHMIWFKEWRKAETQ